MAGRGEGDRPCDGSQGSEQPVRAGDRHLLDSRRLRGPIVTVDHLRKTYGTGVGVQDVSFRVEQR